MATATAEPRAVIVEPSEREGVAWLLVRLEMESCGFFHYGQVQAIGKVLSYGGQCYSFRGWNSDTGQVYYAAGGSVAYRQ